jgi:hypothetical protein
MRRYGLLVALSFLVTSHGIDAGAPKKTALPKEADYYPIQSYNLPKDEVLEVGALDVLPDGRLVFGTRRGEVWIVNNPLDPKTAKFSRYAQGLHEILGLGHYNGWIYVTASPTSSKP